MPLLPPKRYLNQDFKIPFYEESTKSYKLKFKVSPRIRNASEQREREAELKEKALRYYVTHYLPEFYTYLFNETTFQEILDNSPKLTLPGDNEPQPMISMTETIELMSSIQRSIKIEHYFNAAPPMANKSVVVVSTNLDFLARREKLEAEGKMPSYESNYEYFRTKNNVSVPTSSTTLAIASLGRQNNFLNDGLRAFNQQHQGFEGQLNINLDFTFTQTSVQLTLNWLVSSLVAQLRRSSAANLTDADTLTLEFGKKNNKPAVVRMSYLLVEESIQNSPLKVGVFSAVLYKTQFHDPMTVAILQNYRTIVEQVENGSINPDAPPYTVWQFLESPNVMSTLSGSFGLNFGTFGSLGDIASGSVALPRPMTPAELAAQHQESIQNEYIKAAKELGLISATDVTALKEGFSTLYTEAEIEKISKEIRSNRDVRRKVFAVQKTKGFTAAASAASVVEDILANPLMPLGLVGKLNPAVARLIRSLGIDQLLKEVMLCLTFGANFEASRLVSAVKTALHSQALNVYYRKPPEPREFIQIPKFDFKSLKPKLKDGDIGNLIKQAAVSALQRMAVTIVEQMANLIREACAVNNPFAGDYGASNINGLLTEPGSVEDGLAGLASKNGLHPSVLRQYLSALSQILSSVDVCNLLNPLGKPPMSLVNRIVEFNQNYDNSIIQQQLSDITSVMGFISDLSGITDVTELCDEIANTVVTLNQENICLNLPNLEDLGDLLPNLPEVNFDCMDRENFINDPTITKAIPEVFNAVAETVEVQFISSAESIKEILLDPVLVRGAESNVLGTADTANLWRPVEATGSLEDLDPAILNDIEEKISSVMTQLEGGADIIRDLTIDCDPSLEDVVGFDVTENFGLFGDIVEEMIRALATSQFNAGLQGLSNNLTNLAEGDGPVIRTYRFKQDFFRDFRDYVQPSKATFISATGLYNAPVHFSAFPTETDPNTLSIDDLSMNPVKPHNIRFSFPPPIPSTVTAPTHEYLQIVYPLNTPGQSQLVEIQAQSTSQLVLSNGILNELQPQLTELGLSEPENSHSSATNIYLQQFLENYIDTQFNFSTLPSNEQEDAREEEMVENRSFVLENQFPQVYATLLKNMFDYIIENGAFDAATLKTLQLFHLNEDCPPDKVADLLDIQGILEQMTREYAEQACNDLRDTARDKVRRALKLGLMLLYIQIALAEIVVKNIFVFAAFNLDSLLTDHNGYLFRFIKQQVKSRAIAFIENPTAIKLPPSMRPGNVTAIKNDILSYFGKKIVRPSITANGGIRYSGTPGDIAFPTGTVFTNTTSAASTTAGFEDIIDYLVSERLHFAATPITNTIQRALAKTNKFPRPMDQALISTYPVLQSALQEPSSITDIQIAAQISFSSRSRVFIVDEVDSVQPPISHYQQRVYSLWYYSGDLTTSIEAPESPPGAHTHLDPSGEPVIHSDHDNITGPHSHATPPLMWDTTPGSNPEPLTDPSSGPVQFRDEPPPRGTGFVMPLIENIYSRRVWIDPATGEQTDPPAQENSMAPPLLYSWSYWAGPSKPYQRSLGASYPGTDAHFEKWYEEQILIFEEFDSTYGWTRIYESRYETNSWPEPLNEPGRGARSFPGDPYRLPWNTEALPIESLGPRRALPGYVDEVYEAYFADFPSVATITDEDLRAASQGGGGGDGSPSPPDPWEQNSPPEQGGGGDPSPDPQDPRSNRSEDRGEEPS